MSINLYVLHGKLRYGTVVDEGKHIEFDHMFHGGGHHLPHKINNHLIPIFKVVDGVYPTQEEWANFLIIYRIR
jgi:hypothetical protein